MITVEINDSKGQKYTKKWESMPEFEGNLKFYELFFLY